MYDRCEFAKNGNPAGRLAIELTKVPDPQKRRRNFRNVIESVSDFAKIPCAVAIKGVAVAKKISREQFNVFQSGL